MATTYTLKRKTFGTADLITAYQEIGAQTKGAKGFKQMNSAVNKNISAYNSSKAAGLEAFKKYQAGGGKSGLREWLQNEGAEYHNAAKQARTNMANAAAEHAAAGVKAGKTADLATTRAMQATRSTSRNPKLAYTAGRDAGAKSVGLLGGLKNSYNRAGFGGKAGMIAGGVALGGLAIKGATSLGKKNNQ